MTRENSSAIMDKKGGNSTMYNYSKLLGKMREKGFTQSDLAKNIGINTITLNQKLKNNSEFKQTEMIKILDYIGEPVSNVTSYFFTH